ELGHDGGRPRVGGVHVQPEPLAAADLRDLGDGVDAGGGGGAHGGGHREGRPARRAVLGDGAGQRPRVHPELRVRLDLPQALLADAEHDPGLLDRGVRVLGGVHAEAGPGQATPAPVQAGRAAASPTSVAAEAVSWTTPKSPSGSPVIWRSQSRTTTSISVATGAVFQSMALTLKVAVSISARIAGGGDELAK